MDYWGRVQNYIKAHLKETVIFAAVLAVLVILAIKYNGFIELLKIIFSPQVAICGLIVYFLVTFKQETSRLIDRIKEVKTPPFSLTTGPPTLRDQMNVPEPANAASESQLEPDRVNAEPQDELKKAKGQATYWFFRYLCTYLSPVHVSIVWAAELRTMSREELIRFVGEAPWPVWDRTPDTELSLNTLSRFKLIRIENNRIAATALGVAFTNFFFNVYERSPMSPEEIQYIYDQICGHDFARHGEGE